MSQGAESLSNLCQILTSDDDFRGHDDVLQDRCQWLLGLSGEGQVEDYFMSMSAQAHGLKQLQLYLIYHFKDDYETGGGVGFIVTEISRIVVQLEGVLER